MAAWVVIPGSAGCAAEGAGKGSRLGADVSVVGLGPQAEADAKVLSRNWGQALGRDFDVVRMDGFAHPGCCDC